VISKISSRLVGVVLKKGVVSDFSLKKIPSYIVTSRSFRLISTMGISLLDHGNITRLAMNSPQIAGFSFLRRLWCG